MSQLVGAAASAQIALERSDSRLIDETLWGDESLFQPPQLLVTECDSDDECLGFQTPWWPRSGTLLGGWDGVAENTFLSPSPWWGTPWTTTGCNARLGFVGYTRDYVGSPLGGCTVRCFNTATNELVSQVTSDANGFYIATTPYADGHYLVVHKSGSPEVAGASVSTLLPG